MTSTVYLKDYRPYPFTLLQVTLDIDLYEDHTIVKNTMQFQRDEPNAVLTLNGEALTEVQVVLNGEPLHHYRLDEHQLIYHPTADTFTLTIVTRLLPHENTALSGLYRTNHLFCTQCEAEGFRRITFFPDRPDVLSLYTTRITACQTRYPLLLSNGHCIDSGPLPEGRHFATWHDPFKKPCYLFALVAGDLSCVSDTYVTRSGRSIALRLYVEPLFVDQCDHALASLKKAMRWDEEQYGREYDLDLYMIVAVSDFNMGAMENKGLNIFNTKYILARPDTATDQDYAHIESVVAHEYFHNWTGNRITCRDWFQLSLKEGLTVFRDQEFSRDMNSRAVQRIEDVRALRQQQFPEDRGQLAHPVRPNSYQEISNFYTATIYNKGAEVIRMQQTLLGEAGFRQGMDLYFERHDGQAVTIDAFVAAMADANLYDLSLFKRWYDQAGTPHVTVYERYDQGTLTLSFTQTCAPTPEQPIKQPFVIPLKCAFFYNNGEQLTEAPTLITLTQAQESIQLKGLKEKPLVSLLRDFSAPIQLEHEQPLAERHALLRFESDGFKVWELSQQLARETILAHYQTASQSVVPTSSLFETYTQLLTTPTHDHALKAMLLTLPGFEDLVAYVTEARVQILEHLRLQFGHQLGITLHATLEQIYHDLWAAEDHTMHQAAYGRRALRQACLTLLMQAETEEAQQICQHLFSHAKTMTDQLKSLTLLAHSKDERVRHDVLDTFYQQWQHEPLVINKWFTVQATLSCVNPLPTLRELMKHPAFSLKNPNNVYALIAAFTQHNPLHFHAPDGSGYAWLTECVLELDLINPQISARLAQPFTRWKTIERPQQQLMQQALRRLEQATVSRDLREVIEKSLV